MQRIITQTATATATITTVTKKVFLFFIIYLKHTSLFDCFLYRFPSFAFLISNKIVPTERHKTLYIVWQTTKMKISSVWSLLLTSTASTAIAGAVDTDSCPLWLAPSHTSTKNKIIYGLYAGRTYQANETFHEYNELAIPLIDFVDAHNRDTPIHNLVTEFVENHLWTGDHGGSQWESTTPAPLAIPGVGVLSNYHSGYSNVDFTQASVLLRDRLNIPGKEVGKTHLSRGAITPYYNVTVHATKSIPAGIELFADFGDVWDGNFTDDAFQDKLDRNDYEEADKIINALVEFYDDVDLANLDLKEDILDFILTTVLEVNAGKHAKIIKSLIPDNPKKLKAVQEAGGSFLYRYNDMIRSSEWLNKNGICLDTIKPGISPIPNAGRGAFAARKIGQGETITITPMLHIADKDVLNQYPIEELPSDDDGSAPQLFYNRDAKPRGKQLLLNYCYGHPESSLVLYPLAPLVTLINHGSNDKANAYITWSKERDHNLPNDHQYHDMPIEELAQTDKVVVVMKIVALRPIQEGEEILLNYGPDWQKAWDQYEIKSDMQKEMKKKGDQHPLQAEDVREMYKSKPFETQETLRKHPYPPNVIPACFLKSRDRPDGYPMFSTTSGREIAEWYEPVNFEDYKGSQIFIVDIMERTKTNDDWFYNYTVEAKMDGKSIEQVNDVPHSACTFVDAPYTSDVHMKGAFRHPIGIMDQHFPQAWRNLRD